MITLRGYQLDIVVQLPSELKNTGVSGLLGNFNDIASDDLISSTGQTIDPNATEEVIHNDFGETCELLVFCAVNSISILKNIICYMYSIYTVNHL